VQAVDVYLHRGHQQHTQGLLIKAADSYRRARQIAQNIKDRGAEGRFYFYILRSPPAVHIYIECAFIDCHRLSRACVCVCVCMVCRACYHIGCVYVALGQVSASICMSMPTLLAPVGTDTMHAICVTRSAALNADMC